MNGPADDRARPAARAVLGDRGSGRAAAFLLALLGAGLAGAVVFTFTRFGGEIEGSKSTGRPVTVTAPSEVVSRAPLLAAERARRSEESRPEPRLSVRGRTRTTWGEPIEASLVLSVNRPGSLASLHRVQADSEGRFGLEVENPIGTELVVTAGADGFESIQLHDVVDEGVSSWSPILELPLAGNALFEGELVDSTLTPWDADDVRRIFAPPGGSVDSVDLRSDDSFGIWAHSGSSLDRERSKPARLDPDRSMFTFEAKRSFHGSLVALAQGLELARADITGASPIRLVLDPADVDARTGSLLVRVVADDGEPISGQVTLRGRRFFADADARFENTVPLDAEAPTRFDGLVAGRLEIRVRCLGRADVVREADVRAGGETVVELVSPRAVAFEMRLATEPGASRNLGREDCVTYRDLEGHRLHCDSTASWNGDELVIRIGGVPPGPAYAVLGRNVFRVLAVDGGTWRAALRPKRPIEFSVGPFSPAEVGRSVGLAVRLLSDGAVPVVDDTTMFVTVEECGFGRAHLMAPSGSYTLEIDAGRGRAVTTPVLIGSGCLVRVDLSP